MGKSFECVLPHSVLSYMPEKVRSSLHAYLLNVLMRELRSTSIDQDFDKSGLIAFRET